MIIVISLNVFIVTTIVLAYIYKVSHDTIYTNLKENSRLLTLSTVNEIEKILLPVQKIPQNLAKIIESGNYSGDEIEKMLRLSLKTTRKYTAVQFH
jgi:hypothetical protein